MVSIKDKDIRLIFKMKGVDKAELSKQKIAFSWFEVKPQTAKKWKMLSLKFLFFFF